ncbi:MAG: aconitase X catalytic domain-containing protein [Candidatus Diapherotrites archaeon]|nr:aconitase X catalytic domain-containing protein [Candidatus Diapherotrites archaeon]
MKLTADEKKMLAGKHGNAVKKSMEILVALGEIFGAKRLIDVASVQVAGVSYHNLGDAGLEFLEELAKDGKVKVLTTLNPAGMDLENWKNLGISPEFAEKQKKVIDAFEKLGVVTTCTCTPYFVGNLPRFGEHIAWSESSAVAFSNSIIGAFTNKEGGPSALAAALTGKTPEYGLHLKENRQAQVLVNVKARLEGTRDFGALGYAIGKKIGTKIPLIKGIKKASIEELKNFSASIATYGGTGLYHIAGITPAKTQAPKEIVSIGESDIEAAKTALNDAVEGEIDLVAIGCPHCSIKELQNIAKLLKGKKVKKEIWICVARPVKSIADKMGYSKTIEESGAKFACDTCMAVAPLKGRFKGLATDSAKGCFYGRGSNSFKTKFCTMEECIQEAIE